MVSHGNEFANVKLNDILRNWEHCMECGPINERKLETWLPPSLGSSKFNVDGDSWSIEVLNIRKGKILLMFSKRVGVRDSKVAERDSNEACLISHFGSSRIFSGAIHEHLIMERDSLNAISWVNSSVLSLWKMHIYFDEIKSLASSVWWFFVMLVDQPMYGRCLS